MATQTITTTVCDMPHQPDVEGTPIWFTLKGVGSFEIDLCGDCTAKFFVPLVKESRRVKKDAAPRSHHKK
jgi:hypothetical protein